MPMVYRLTMLFRNAAQNYTISDFKVHVKMAHKKKSGRNGNSARRVYVPLLALMPISCAAELGWVKLCKSQDVVALTRFYWLNQRLCI